MVAYTRGAVFSQINNIDSPLYGNIQPGPQSINDRPECRIPRGAQQSANATSSASRCNKITYFPQPQNHNL